MKKESMAMEKAETGGFPYAFSPKKAKGKKK